MREDRSEEAVAEMIRLLAKIELVNLRNGLRTKDKEKGDENDKE